MAGRLQQCRNGGGEGAAGTHRAAAGGLHGGVVVSQLAHHQGVQRVGHGVAPVEPDPACAAGGAGKARGVGRSTGSSACRPGYTPALSHGLFQRRYARDVSFKRLTSRDRGLGLEEAAARQRQARGRASVEVTRGSQSTRRLATPQGPEQTNAGAATTKLPRRSSPEQVDEPKREACQRLGQLLQGWRWGGEGQG